MRRQMWGKVVGMSVAALTWAACGVVLVVGCLPEQERTNYGPAEALGSRAFPDPQTPPGGGGAPPGPSSLCDGKGPVATECDVSWKDKIYGPMLSPTGTMKCAAGGCHDAINPVISKDNAKTAWAQLVAYKLRDSQKPYLDPCVKDLPDNSGILCNLSGTSCGSQMPQTGGGAKAATAEEIATITAWLKCGAPDN